VQCLARHMACPLVLVAVALLKGGCFCGGHCADQRLRLAGTKVMRADGQNVSSWSADIPFFFYACSG
jgi:hypothetical protein